MVIQVQIVIFGFQVFIFIFQFDNFTGKHDTVILKLFNYCFFQAYNFFLRSLVEAKS